MKKDKATFSESIFKIQTGISTNIIASPKRIMKLLTDTSTFTKWNSTVFSIEGKIIQGEKIKLISKLAPKRVFNLKVAELSENRLVLSDGFPPIFSGVRTFTLTQKQNGTTDFSMIEVFKGLLLPMIKKSLPNFTEDFEQYAEDLKIEAEKN